MAVSWLQVTQHSKYGLAVVSVGIMTL